jgi:ligand-binding sensor domain-containing protein
MNINALFIASFLTIFSACIGQEQNSSDNRIDVSPSWLAGDTVHLVDGEIRGIVQDSKNNLWFASNGNGVFKFDGTTIINYKEKHGLSSDYVWMVKEGKDGKMWFKTNVQPADVAAICCFDGHEFKTILPDTNPVTYDFEKGELLFDYYLEGKSLSKMEVPHTSALKNDLHERHKYAIYGTCLDRDGNIWLGTPAAGICMFDGEKYTWFDDIELGSAVRDIYQDKNGTIWAGNNGDGLFRFDGQKFINFSREKGVHNPDFEKYPIGKPGLMSRVWKITEDNQGNLWVATIDNGAWMYDGEKLINFTPKDGLSMEGIGIWTIYKDKEGKLWFGTEGDGVYTFDGKKMDKFKP